VSIVAGRTVLRLLFSMRIVEVNIDSNYGDLLTGNCFAVYMH